MYNELAKCNINNLLLNTFVKDNVNKIKLYDIGYIKDKCNISILALLIQCNENIDIFNDKQKANINILINRYGR